MTTTPVGRVSPLREVVAEEIRVLLTRRRMSASRLARELGVSQTYVWRRLSGETAFDLDDLERIAAVFGIEPADLVTTVVGRVGGLNRRYAEVPARPKDNRPISGPPAGRQTRPPSGPPRTPGGRPTQRRPVRVNYPLAA